MVDKTVKRTFVTKIRNRDSKQGGRKAIEIPAEEREYFAACQDVKVTIESI